MRLLTLTVAAIIGLSAQSQELFISKVASPLDEKTNGKFVTLYNPSEQEIDFDLSEYYLVRETNGGGTFANKKLVGKLAGLSSYVVAGKTAFAEIYKQAPSCVGGCVTGNGNDAYYLYKDGNETTGTLIDIYGLKNCDGLGTSWEYTNSIAERKSTITKGNSVWTTSEWEITKDKLVADISPWSHSAIVATLNKGQYYGKVDIYPNPTTSTLTISIEEEMYSITVSNITGLELLNLKPINTQCATLDLSKLTSGIYIITITTKTEMVVIKKVIKR